MQMTPAASNDCDAPGASTVGPATNVHGVDVASSTATGMLSLTEPAAATTYVWPGRLKTWTFALLPLPGVTLTSDGFRDTHVTAAPVTLPNVSRTVAPMNAELLVTEYRSERVDVAILKLGPVPAVT